LQGLLAVGTAAGVCIEVQSALFTAPLLSAVGLGVVFLAIRQLPDPRLLIALGLSASAVSYLVALAVAGLDLHRWEAQGFVGATAVAYAALAVPAVCVALKRLRTPLECPKA
jgi:hypothetical protein